MEEKHTKVSPPKTGLARILSAAKYSWQGIVAALKSEAAFRQDFILAVVLLALAFCLDVSALERCVLIAPLFILLIAELLNSAIEKCVDLCTSQIHPLAKFAKDAGSAAVFFALVNIALCWLIILLR